MIRHLTCINCPLGCALRVTVDEDTKNIRVTGNTCPRGKTYGISEVTDPKRMVTSTVFVKKGVQNVVSCKTERPVSKEKIFHVMNALKNTVVEAPVQLGDVLIEDVADTGIRIVATRNVEKKQG
ncbi:DUF1667 domain-containing protein [uncultured Dubosiella sp.]|uniref:DUF1667 domain-containing protein n=1 Tax=uncultured Dubosiella sp. TaxID=1937011 RepID=UPI0026122EDF|nr:DUF1667 domain-containing protein [uncultured Dubosiella sp.]